MIVTHFALYLIASHHKHSCIALCPNYCMAFFFIRVDAANEAAYELITEPIQEPQAGEQQEDADEHTCEEVADPADLQVKPWSITSIFSIQHYYLVIVHLSF